MSRMEFEFNLEWDELPEELREQKVDEAMKYLKANGEWDMEEEVPDETWEDRRASVEHGLAAHFPIYF